MPPVAALARRVTLLAALASVAAGTATCGGGKEGTSAPVPVAVTKASGDGQSAQVNQRPAQPLVVKVVDANGEGVASVTVVWTAEFPRRFVTDTTITDPQGFAREQPVLDTLVGSYHVTATVGWLPGATFTITGTPGPAATLFWLVQPTHGGQGLVISPPIQLGMRDRWNNVVTAETVSVHIGITAGTGAPGAKLAGTSVRSPVQGVVTFDDLAIDQISGGYRLTAQGGAMPPVTCAPFTVGAGIATGLAFVFMPYASGSVVGHPLVGVQVRIVDGLGGTVTSRQDSITVAIADGVGVPATLGGTLTRRATAGIAVFDSLLLDKAGERVLIARAPGLDSAFSGTFYVSPGPATTLVFLDQPPGVAAGAVISPFHLGVLDSFGDLTDSAATVTIAISPGTGPAGAVLSGTLTRQPIGGLVTFDDLAIDHAGTGYRLVVSAPGLTQAVSDPFDVGP